MVLVAWGLDEIIEAVGGIYALIIGILLVLVALERNLYADPSHPSKEATSGHRSRTPANHSSANSQTDTRG